MSEAGGPKKSSWGIGESILAIIALVVTVVVIIVFLAVLFVAVPSFEKIFKDFGAELPACTVIVLKVYHTAFAYWPVLFIAGVAVAAAPVALFAFNPRARRPIFWTSVIVTWGFLAVGALLLVLGLFLPQMTLMSNMANRSGG